MPRCGRCKDVVGGVVRRRARKGSRACCCAGRRDARRGAAAGAASGIQRYGSHQMLAPYSESARSKLASGSGTRRRLASTSGNTSPVSSWQPSRGGELRGRHVDTDRARAAPREPRGEVGRAAAELDDVEPVDVAEQPQLRLGHVPNIPQLDLLRAPSRRRLRVGVLGVGLRPVLAVREGVVREIRQSGSDKPVGEEQRELAPRARLRVRAVDDVLARARSRSRRGSCRAPQSAGFVAPIIVADAGDRVLAAHGEREHGPGRDERDELAEERLALVLGVVLLCELPRDPRGGARRAARSPRRSKRATISPQSPRLTPSGLTSTSVVSMAIGARSLGERRVGRSRGVTALERSRRGRTGCSSSGRRRHRRDRRRAVRAGLPDRLERRAALRARLLEPRRADGTDEERGVDVPAADGAAEVALGEPLLDRADLELALADAPRGTRAAGRRGRRSGRGTAAPGPAASAMATSHGSSIRRRASLQHPVRRREPEDDDEEERRGCAPHPRRWSRRSRERRRHRADTIGQSRSLPRIYPSANAIPTIAARRRARRRTRRADRSTSSPSCAAPPSSAAPSRSASR